MQASQPLSPAEQSDASWDMTDTALPPLRSIALVWLGYSLLLALIDGTLLPLDRPPAGYYLAHMAGALVLLVGAGFAQSSPRSSYSLLLSTGWIVVVTTVAVVPGVAGQIATGAESLALRGLPVLMLALLLLAWRYGWLQLLAFSAGAALLACIPLLVPATSEAPSMGPAFVVVAIQTTSFLAVGGALTLLMRQIRAQQRALAHANSQLRRVAELREALAVSDERSRLARELHDTLAHTLSGLSIQLEGAEACWEQDPPRSRAIITQARAVVRGGLQETRRALSALRAGPLETHGLVEAVRALANSCATQAALYLELDLARELPELSEAAEQCVYRVAQEALANVARHAAATTLWVQLRADGGQVELYVRDDGRGFDLPHANGAGQYGLHGLRERAVLLGGTLLIESRPTQGTTVLLRLGR